METNLKKLTEKAIRENINCKFLDYTLRFEVEKEEEEKVIDLDSLDLQDIEKLLEIRKIQDVNDINKYNYEEFNSWFDLIYFTDELIHDDRINVIHSIIGYQIINNKIRLYFQSHYTNS